MAKQGMMFKVYNRYNIGLLTDNDVLQYCLALLSDYCETHIEVELVQWLKTVGIQHRDMKVTMPKVLREKWLGNQYRTPMYECIETLLNWRRVPSNAGQILTSIYFELETYQWGKEKRVELKELEQQYYTCLTVGKEIRSPIVEIAPLIEADRDNQEALMCASDAVEAAGWEASASHLRSGGKHVYTCSVFQGIWGKYEDHSVS